MSSPGASPRSKGNMEETVKVYCRLRPFMHVGSGEATDEQLRRDTGNCCVDGDSGTGVVTYRSSGKSSGDGSSRSAAAAAAAAPMQLKLTGFLPPDCEQETVYEAVGSGVVDGVVQGFNGTIFAYGQTGSGKTFTMRGEGMGGVSKQAGIIPRSIDHLFRGLTAVPRSEFTIKISYLQIYCEILSDLLQPENSNLSIRQKSNGEVYVEGLTKAPVGSLEQAMQLLASGDTNRNTAATLLNAHSSRSHAAVLVHVEQRVAVMKDVKPTIIRSTLVLVDLAGSERAKQSGVQYQRFEEMKAINLSLSALGNCVAALSKAAAAGGAGRKPHIPYRDSKLTRLLQQSLGGNARTALVVTVPQESDDERGETRSTLKFAQRALSVKVCAQVSVEADYQHLYSLIQKELDAKTEEAAQLGIENARVQKKLDHMEAETGDARRALAQMQVQLESEREGFSTTLALLENAEKEEQQEAASKGLDSEAQQEGVGDGGATGSGRRGSANGGGNATSAAAAAAAVEAATDMWKKEVQLLKETHAKELEEVKRKTEDRLGRYRASAKAASEEWSTSEAELSREREAHLQSLKEYREAQKRLRANDKETSERFSELHAELSEKGAEIENLVEKDAQRERRVAELQTQLEEAKEKAGLDWDPSDWVHRDQVSEMERLFKLTIDKLSKRVESLESGKAGAGSADPPPRIPSSSAPRSPRMSKDAVQLGSHALLAQLSKGTAGAGGEGGLHVSNKHVAQRRSTSSSRTGVSAGMKRDLHVEVGADATSSTSSSSSSGGAKGKIPRSPPGGGTGFASRESKTGARVAGGSSRGIARSLSTSASPSSGSVPASLSVNELRSGSSSSRSTTKARIEPGGLRSSSGINGAKSSQARKL